MDVCDECGFSYTDHSEDRFGGEIRALSTVYRAALVDPSVHAPVLVTRPAADVWSPVEYGCHVRDVLLAQRERLLLALVEDEPTFVPMYRDQRAGLARYGDEAPVQVAGELALAADLFAWVVDGIDGPAWERSCIYSYPEPSRRTLSWLVQHTLHEGTHHLRDIERTISSSGR